MREANWDDIFQKKRDEAPEDDRLSSIIPWEDWLTFAIVTIAFLASISSIQGANWVDGLPNLYPLGFAGLIAGYALSRVRVNELLIHPFALALGAVLIYLQLLAVTDGGPITDRTTQIVDRMRAWWTALTMDGISTDGLPVIIMLLVLTWLGAYISSWAVFRWRNAWIALGPSGFALMWNISFIPGQFSYAVVVFCFAAVLLVMRLHVAEKQKQWTDDKIAYPEFMSLSVLHATFWVALGLLIVAWFLPLAHRSESAQERWEDFTAPVTRHLTPLSRVFVSVNAKKPINVHNFEDALPFQGKINPSDREAVELNVELSPEMAAFLREQSFDEYTSSGWKVNVNGVPLPAGEETAPGEPELEGARQEVTINVTVEGGNNERLFSVGQPIVSDQVADARVGENPADVSSLDPEGRLRNGDTYTVTGSVAIPSVEQLAFAGTEYPQWVIDRYTALPEDFPDRVRLKAEEVAGGSVGTPYLQAGRIEQYLRTFPIDYDVPETPPGQDTVDFFLFDLQRGYFDYHASAMAMMLRTLGVPSRVATGYAIDPLAQDGVTGAYSLTQKEAYAWPEVYFPGIGWVEFSPTPDQPVIPRRIETPIEEPVVPGEESPSERGLGDGLDLGDIAGEERLQPAAPIADTGSDSGFPLMIALIAIGAVVAVVLVGARFAWSYGLGGLSQPAQVWEKTARLARFTNAAPQTSETPREFAARLQRDVPGADAAGYVAARYETDRFGHKPLTEDEEEKLESAWASLRNALVRKALRLKPR